MAVGMATAESMLRARFGELVSNANALLGHFTYVVAGDGDFQEPVTLGAQVLWQDIGVYQDLLFFMIPIMHRYRVNVDRCRLN